MTKRTILSTLVILLLVSAVIPESAWASKPWKGTSRSGVKPKPVPAIEGYDPVAPLRNGGKGAPAAGQGLSMPSLDSMIESAGEESEEDDEFALGGPAIAYDPKKLPALLKEMEALYAKLEAAETKVKTAWDTLSAMPQPDELRESNKDWVDTSVEHMDEGKHDLAEIIQTVKALPTDKPTERLGNQVEDWNGRMEAIRDDIAYAEESEAEWREKINTKETPNEDEQSS